MINNLESYKVFYYVAKEKSITLAAKELMISQPAVSQSIKLLEGQIGTSLFVRTSKGMKLTREGELLFSYVSKGYEQIETGERKLNQMLNLELGEVHIGASDMTLQFFLLPFLEKFHEKYPGIKVKVTNAPTPETLNFLQAGHIDFGVVSTPLQHEEGINVREVMEIQDTFVAGRRFMQYKNRTLDFKDLEKLPLICLEGNTSTRNYMDEFLEAEGVKVLPEFELATSDMIVQFALKNLGVGSVMRKFAQEQIENGKLFELRFNKMIPKRKFCIVTMDNLPLSVAASNLLKIIYDEI